MRILGLLFATFTMVLLSVAVIVGAAYRHYSRGLPDYTQLADYEPPVTTRVYDGDGRLLAEYATEKRIFLPIEAIPETLVHAFLAAEDKNFYEHPGIDMGGVARAILTNLSNFGTDRRLVGASTITQQVVKNFLLTNEVSIDRKVREAILAFRITRAFTKDRILELYLNEIYLGHSSYGVVAAGLNYFNKTLDQLTLGEMAFLAALPKAPSNYDPVHYPDAAIARRNWVLGRMAEDGDITAEAAAAASREPIILHPREVVAEAAASDYAEEIRREIAERYGEKALYGGGLSVHATLDPRLQSIAVNALRHGLEDYDRRHGWRGPVARIVVDATTQGGHGTVSAIAKKLAAVPPPPGMGTWQLAAVTSVNRRSAEVVFSDGSTGQLTLKALRWARPALAEQRVGRAVTKPSDVLAVGDVVPVERTEGGTLALRQIPEIDGALVAMDPHTGRVLAMVGGYDFQRSQFNRATQALRQPGSAFKPIVYLAALERGYTPASVVSDSPIVLSQGVGLPPWRPSNYDHRFYGPLTLRVGLALSRNVMTVRLAQKVGMKRVAEMAERLDVVDEMPRYLAYALGAGETTLMRLTGAYAIIANGGRQVTPSIIDRIQDRYGLVIYRHDKRPCIACRGEAWFGQAVPQLPDTREQIIDPGSAYQMVTMLQAVIEQGTGRRLRSLGRPLAGKTGTSNDSKDTWFIGFTPDLVAGVFVGFDEPRTLGNKEQGASVAAPIFGKFMADALADQPAVPFRTPAGIRMVRVNPRTGQRTTANDTDAIWEPFKPGTKPANTDDSDPGTPRVAVPSTGTGGLY